MARGHLRVDTALFTGREPGGAERQAPNRPASRDSQPPSVGQVLAVEAASFEGVVDGVSASRSHAK